MVMTIDPHAYVAEYGDGAIDRLRGMISIAVLEGDENLALDLDAILIEVEVLVSMRVPEHK